ncbi:MAG: HDIG domain-containing protein [Anaerolineae bacterium]|nr:HDIG domain-containing protein [Anaerolineae bacterium]NIN98646.1 HDIG domain-containing protein [Anaerolineae bacterium]NIQ81533.1 HDIG domain-containing protein [Anaerolineae bacterium]
MSSSLSEQPEELAIAEKPLTARRTVRVLVFCVLLILALTFILSFQFIPSRVRLEVGDVSPQDIRAPSRITYQSEITTEEARQTAEAAVQEIYYPTDAGIARQEIDHVSQIFNYVDTVRHDAYAATNTKIELIQAMPDLELSPTVVNDTVQLDEDSWERISQEILSVLRDEVLPQEVRPDDVEELKNQVNTFISLELPEDDAAIVEAWVRNFIVPNTFPNPEGTEEARARARESVEPVYVTLEEGEIIVREGEVTTALAWEALGKLGLRQPQIGWIDIAVRILLTSLLVLILALYLLYLHPSFWDSWRDMLLVGLLAALAVLAAKLMIPGHVVLGYLFPLAAISMLLTALVDTEIAIVVTIVLSLIVGFIAGGSLEFVLYCFAGGAVASLRLWRIERLNAFLWAGVYVALSNLGVILLFRALEQDHDLLGTFQIAGASLANAILAMSLTFGGFFLFSNVLNITTSLQLLELGRPTHPLLRELLLKAPGTYHHSLMVGNLTEQAAQAVGANALLARVGAYYHDIGKMLRPYFFAENQSDGVNPHDRLDPLTSAQIITSHVKDGLQLAKKYGLPQEIRDFIPQHHGTALSSYFYQEALEKAESSAATSEKRFRYPGPKPRSREAAILMLADEVEAASRANRPRSVEELGELVGSLMRTRTKDGQLDESDLTLRDLQRIEETFVNVLQGVYHPRIKYPEDVEEDAGREEEIGDRAEHPDRPPVSNKGRSRNPR